MNVIKSQQLQSKPIHHHDSEGASIARLGSVVGGSSIVRIQLEPDGVLGLHRAYQDQYFIVVQGHGFARTEGAEPVEVEEGDVLFWKEGELHETRAGPAGLTAIVVEGKYVQTTGHRVPTTSIGSSNSNVPPKRQRS